MIKVDSLYKTYDPHSRNSNTVLKNISLTLPDKGFVCIVGESGCGKTSLLNAIGGLDSFERGIITVEKTKIRRYGSREAERERNASFGYVFQNYHMLPEHSVMYNIYIGMHSLGISHREKIKRAREVLRVVGMEHYGHRITGELSGGQQQRVAIARALARRPKVIFADEPTGNLDEANTVNICNILRDISKTGLVVMVTHDRKIASFFADRIILISDGRITADISEWERGALTYDSEQKLYTEDFNCGSVKSESAELKILSEDGAAPVRLTVIAGKDRIIIKTDDLRKITCTGKDEAPQIIEGKRPELRHEASGGERTPELTLPAQTKQCRAGRGITVPMIWREAVHIMRLPGTKSAATRIFLVLLAALALFTCGDLLTVSHLDPQTFVTCDSHMLRVTLARGEAMTELDNTVLASTADEFREALNGSGFDIDLIPVSSLSPMYSDNTFRQMSSSAATLSGFSYAPVSRLDKNTLIYGRLPETSTEAVFDRWVLEKLLTGDSCILNGIYDITYFLGKSIRFTTSSYEITVVGICDAGNPTIYLNKTGLISVKESGTSVMTIDEFTTLYPGYIDRSSLPDGECVIIEKNAGAIWGTRIGREYTILPQVPIVIVDSYKYSTDCYASVIINEHDRDSLYDGLMGLNFDIYCADKNAVAEYIRTSLPDDLGNRLIIKLTDRAGDEWAAERASMRDKTEKRLIVTLTVLLVSVIMLFILQRTELNKRIGMIAVYRLLCIPGRKLISVFAANVFLNSLIATLPAVGVMYGVMKLLSYLPSVDYNVYLPWQTPVFVYLGILVLHMAASVLPALRLLRIPPAQLAMKQDR